MCFLVCVVVCVSFLAPSHKSCGVFQVSVEGHWTYSWTDALVPQSLYVSLTWTAGILEICCSLRAKKKQEEETYARATVALTRARKICVLFCSLDMKGLLGAATVLDSFMYGVGHCWNGAVNMHLRFPSLEDCPDDEFLNNFDQRDGQTGPMAQRRYSSVVLAECVADILSKRHKVRRLHFVIVDLWRRWKINQRQVKLLTDSDSSILVLMWTTLLRWHLCKGKHPCIADVLCMATAWMAQTSPATSWNKQVSSNPWASDTFMMHSVCVLRLAFAMPPLQPFSSNQKKCLVASLSLGLQPLPEAGRNTKSNR